MSETTGGLERRLQLTLSEQEAHWLLFHALLPASRRLEEDVQRFGAWHPRSAPQTRAFLEWLIPACREWLHCPDYGKKAGPVLHGRAKVEGQTSTGQRVRRPRRGPPSRP